MIPIRTPIVDLIKSALLERGWKIQEDVKPNGYGEMHEWVSPMDGKLMTLADAVWEQESFDYNRNPDYRARCDKEFEEEKKS